MTLSAHDIAELRKALQDAVIKCSERCLYQSSKWAAELLNALPESDAQDDHGLNTQFISPIISPNFDPDEAALEAKEISRFLMAKAFFECREYDRCAAVFLPDSILSSLLSPKAPESPMRTRAKGKAKDVNSSRSTAAISLPKLSQKSLFLALYAKFLSGEKRKVEESEMTMGPNDLGSHINKQLLPVGRFLAAWFEERTRDDGEVAGSQGWLEYLYGMVLAKEKNDERALDFLIQSVHKYTMNWGCWLEITSLVSRVEDLNRILRICPQNIMSYMFHIHTSLELYQQSSELAHSVERLLSIFPTSSFLLTCNALVAYHAKDLIAAEHHFSRILALHPHRLDSLDNYSNILYVLNLRPKLAFLAHMCVSVDKFRPEACVVIGNYYSLLSMHEKAVQYFRRALTLDRTCLSAWTLMGHEYVELKNTHAAIESYRRAVDVNRRDYRAWYGLGQTYEMLEMHTYSLWYYKKAAGLRPWDDKMWMAVGSCLQKMGRERDGIKALKRALLAHSESNADGDSISGPGRTGQMDPEVLLQIATMYDQLGEQEEAKAYMELCMSQENGEDGPEGTHAESAQVFNDSNVNIDQGEDEGICRKGTGVTIITSKARMWLAKYAMRISDYAAANRLATELCQDGIEIEEAKALVREVRSRQEATGMLNDPSS